MWACCSTTSAAVDGEKSKDKTAIEKASLWSKLSAYKGASQEIKDNANKRAKYWTQISKEVAAKCDKATLVIEKYELDKKKLDKLMKLKDSTLPAEKKKQLKDEFNDAYGTWMQVIENYQIECRSTGKAGQIGVELVYIAGGDFLMGNEKGDSDEKYTYNAKVDSFRISKSEVTVSQYGECVNEGKCTKPDKGSYCNWGKYERRDHPVNCVSWEQARAFAQWVGGRLPTEAEWEYTARSRGKAQRYPWAGNEISCMHAVTVDSAGEGCGRSSTWPVCSTTKGNTEQGVCDMVGNVWEWVEDIYVPNYTHRDSKVAQYNSGRARVRRGGSWYSPRDELSATRRGKMLPQQNQSMVGFRVVMPVGSR